MLEMCRLPTVKLIVLVCKSFNARYLTAPLDLLQIQVPGTFESAFPEWLYI